jgi:hypothetical protein
MFNRWNATLTKVCASTALVVLATAALAVAGEGSASGANTEAVLAAAAPAITAQPVNQSVDLGASATFTAAATGNPTPTVQWQVSPDGGTTWVNAPGLTTPTISGVPSAFENGWKFRAVFTNGGGSATTNAATLNVGLPAVNLPQGVFWTGQPVDVVLSRATSSTVQVQWVTASGPSSFLNQREWIADPAAFSPSSGTVTFAPGQTTAEISLTVLTQSATGCSIAIPPSGCFPEVSIQLKSATNAQLGNDTDVDLDIF